MRLINFITGKEFRCWSYSNRLDHIAIGVDDMDELQLRIELKDNQPYLMYHGFTYRHDGDQVPPEMLHIYDTRPMLKEDALDRKGKSEFLCRRLNNLDVLELVSDYGTEYGRKILEERATKKEKKRRKEKKA